MTESFPRQQARTRRFTLGVPRAFQVSPDGGRVTFLRTKSGTDPVSCLWQLDVATGEERLIADPVALGADDENLSPQERARRERMRETGAGIVGYATDAAHALAVFALSGQVYAASLGGGVAGGGAAGGGAGGAGGGAGGAGGGAGGAPRLLPTRTPALDPRPDPAGSRVAYVHDGALRICDLATGDDAAVAAEDGVTFGLAEFVAAEEMGRTRGYWWSPDGERLLVARVDESMVKRWHIADPANPDKPAAEVGYPAAGTPNADVRLFLAEPAGSGTRTEVLWDREAFPYLAAAAWGDDALVVTQSRDQKTVRVFSALTGAVLLTDTDPAWVDLIDGVPAQLGDGNVVWTRTSEDTRRLVVAPAAQLSAAGPVTPPGLQVREVLGTDGGSVLFTASTEPTEVGVWRYGPDGLTEVATAPGVHHAAAAGGTTVVVSRTLADPQVATAVRRSGQPDARIASLAETPHLPHPDPRFLSAGADGVRTAVLFPSWHREGTRLPVLMDPYGGPHLQRVLKSSGLFRASQWFAEQGFAVIVADGRGTPGRGPAWERAVYRDLANPALDGQVTALHAAAEKFADLDTSRVGIRGWSFGGYLSALAVLRRPDVFHAGIAGAPVTDWRLYDTHYTERYLGNPAEDAGPYEQSSIISDPERVEPTQARPLLLIHGMADDNVVVAHSLRLSSALLAAGYPHSVLPLSGVTHMTPQEVVAENLLLLQVAFLRQALSAPATVRL